MNDVPPPGAVLGLNTRAARLTSGATSCSSSIHFPPISESKLLNAAHRFQQELPGSELRIFDDAGHFVWEDAATESTQALVEFLGR